MRTFRKSLYLHFSTEISANLYFTIFPVLCKFSRLTVYLREDRRILQPDACLQIPTRDRDRSRVLSPRDLNRSQKIRTTGVTSSFVVPSLCLGKRRTNFLLPVVQLWGDGDETLTQRVQICGYLRARGFSSSGRGSRGRFMGIQCIVVTAVKLAASSITIVDPSIFRQRRKAPLRFHVARAFVPFLPR